MPQPKKRFSHKERKGRKVGARFIAPSEESETEDKNAFSRRERKARKKDVGATGRSPLDSKPSRLGATVLLVEDEQSMLYVLEKTLLKHGYKVLKATDGDMAVEIHRRHKETIDVVMLDLGLPKVAGLDVLLKIKQAKPDAKVVIASGYLEPELRSEIDRAGVKYFLLKPYMLDEVLKTFQRLIERA